MKKIVALIAVLFSVVYPVNSFASEQKALVIIDSYFDSRSIGGNVTCLVVVTKSNCTDIVTRFPASLSDNINHGNAMVEVAKKQNPNIRIIALRSATTPTSDVNAGNFIDALNWVNDNSNLVSAVSFSRFFNGTSVCTPASANTAQYGGVTGANNKIVELVTLLKSKGIFIFASTGNRSGRPVDYPACLLDTNSVGVGGINRSGATVSSFQFDSNTDFFAPISVNVYRTEKFGLIPNTTSAATVAVAAQSMNGIPLAKVVPVLS